MTLPARGAVVAAILAFAAALAALWGLAVAPSNETPPPQDVGWNHRNFR